MCTTCRHHGLENFWTQPIKLLLLRENKDTNVHILLSKCLVCGNNPHLPQKNHPRNPLITRELRGSCMVVTLRVTTV